MIPGQLWSPIEHLAKTLFLSRWNDARFVMFTAAFDASGTEHDQSAVVVAGFISSTSDWLDFEKHWNVRLRDDGIEYFHMVDFAASRNQFKGWKNQEVRRRTLLSDLLDIIARHCYRKFGCAVLVKEWQAGISQANKEHFRISAYCIAALFSTVDVDAWTQLEQMNNPAEIIFEDGDTGKGLLQHYMSSRKPDPIFRPKQDTARKDGSVIPGFVPLQAADFLAYEIIQGVKNHANGMLREPRYGIGEFYRIPGEIKYPSSEDFSNFDAMLRAIKKLMSE